jgi:hypothetical protein
MGTFSTVKRVAPGTLVAVAFLAFLVFPSLAGAEDGWISGTITSGILGDPMGGATVSVQNTTFSGTTDAAGYYNLSVPPGNYTVKASATNYADKTSGVLRVTAGNTTGYSTYLEKLKGSLSGRITDYDDGTPIQYVSVTPEGWFLGAMTDADGRYSFDSLDVGSYKMNLTPLPPYGATNFTAVIKAGQNVVKDLRLKAVSLVVFTVKDTGGKPLLGATVTVGNYTTTTDVDGLATLEVAPYHYVWKVQADGYKTVIQDDTVNKGDIKAYQVTMTKVSSGGGGAGIPLAIVGGGVAAILVVVLIVVIFMRRKKAPSGGPAGAPGAPGAPGEAGALGAPPGQKTQAQKMKDWADFEKMYGRPHPDAPGWVSAGAAAASAPKPKCPKDGGSVTFEPFSGQYFCSKCDERYTAEQVFRKEDQVLEESRPAEAPKTVPGAEEPDKIPAGEKLELSAAQPTWALEHGQTMTGEDYVAPGAAAPQGAAPPPAPEAASPPPAAAPMEAAPVSDDEQAAEAATPEGVNPEAGPLFSMPKPIDYTDLPPPPPPKEPPKLDEEK